MNKQQNPSATVGPPPTITFPKLELSAFSQPTGDSTALITFRALAVYRQDRMKWLVNCLGRGLHSDAAEVLAELESIDTLQDEIAQSVEACATSAYNRAMFNEGIDGHEGKTPNDLQSALDNFLKL